MALWLLSDQERRDSLMREGEMLRLAYLFGYAMNDPKLLQKESQSYQSRLGNPNAAVLRDNAAKAALADVYDQLRRAGRMQ